MVNIDLINTVSGQLYCFKGQTYNLIKKIEFELATITEYVSNLCQTQGRQYFCPTFFLCKEQYNNMLLVGFVHEIDFLPLPK